MRIDLPQCNFRNCKYQFDGNCTDRLMYERCEFNRMKDRLQIDPSGSDKIDELEEAEGYVHPERHGYWIPIFENTADEKRGVVMKYKCSECGNTAKDETYSHAMDYKFFPRCSARMDGNG